MAEGQAGGVCVAHLVHRLYSFPDGGTTRMENGGRNIQMLKAHSCGVV